jgi:hypothetical protein
VLAMRGYLANCREDSYRGATDPPSSLAQRYHHPDMGAGGCWRGIAHVAGRGATVLLG